MSFLGELLGFDSRVLEERIARSWPESRRDAYLLDPSILAPRSVDRAVWPSIFHIEGRRNSEFAPSEPSIRVSNPDYRLSVLGLWSSYAEMIRVTSENELNVHAASIAIEIFTPRGVLHEPDWRARLEGWPSCTIESPTDWVTLGFDVADIGFLSGLSNVGWSRNERVVWRKRHGRLNRYGLLAELSVAIDAVSEIEDRAPEHAPFYPFRLLQRA